MTALGSLFSLFLQPKNSQRPTLRCRSPRCCGPLRIDLLWCPPTGGCGGCSLSDLLKSQYYCIIVILSRFSPTLNVRPASLRDMPATLRSSPASRITTSSSFCSMRWRRSSSRVKRARRKSRTSPDSLMRGVRAPQPHRCQHGTTLFTVFWQCHRDELPTVPTRPLARRSRHADRRSSASPKGQTPLPIFAMVPAFEAVKELTIAGSALCALRDGRSAASSG